MAIPLYLTTIEQDIFDTFRYLPHAVAVGVGFVTVAAAWKNQQIQKKRKRLEQYRALHGGQLLAWFLVAVYFAMLISITLLSREPGSRTGVDLKLFETWGNLGKPASAGPVFCGKYSAVSAVRCITAGGGAVSSEMVVLCVCGICHEHDVGNCAAFNRARLLPVR